MMRIETLDARRLSEADAEAIAALLATVVFGLGWAAIELERVGFGGSGYDASSPGTEPTPMSLWNLAAAHPDRSARTRSIGPEIRPPAARSATGRAEQRDDRWTRMDPTRSHSERTTRRSGGATITSGPGGGRSRP